MLLEIGSNNSSSLRIVLQDVNIIAQIIGTIMVVIYVVYTYKTFKQIKKQTDYQQDAYLKVESFLYNDIDSETQSNELNTIIIRKQGVRDRIITRYIQTELSKKMANILQPIFKFDSNLFEGNFYTVSFINYGNAEVNKVSLNISITINNSKELVDKRMLQNKYVEDIEIEINEIIERNGGRIRIPILSTASFPIFSINLSGEYFDVRNKKYFISNQSFNGENPHFHKLSS